ncbi:hypothetical protein GQ473_04895 [archaeon]|nr:hypothetical protein [archaeon]
MAYNATYDSDDMDNIVVDGLGTAGVTTIGFMAIIVIILLIGWFKKKSKQLK